MTHTKDEALEEALALNKKAEKNMIYKTFEQWMNGDFLEMGEPRKKAYSKDELLLVEMGWKYGYDAGRAVEQALDKKAENARELGLDYEPVREDWGPGPHEVHSLPPAAPVQRCTSCDGTGDVHDQTGEWRGTCHCEAGQAIKAKPPAQPAPASWVEMVTANLVREGVNKHKARELAEHFYSLAQRQWVGLTDEQIESLWDHGMYVHCSGITALRAITRAIEAKLKEKNT